MRKRLHVAGVLLIWTIAAVAAAMPAFAAQEGHFDKTLSVAGAVDLTVQTESGNISVKPGDLNPDLLDSNEIPTVGLYG